MHRPSAHASSESQIRPALPSRLHCPPSHRRPSRQKRGAPKCKPQASPWSGSAVQLPESPTSSSPRPAQYSPDRHQNSGAMAAGEHASPSPGRRHRPEDDPSSDSMIVQSTQRYNVRWRRRSNRWNRHRLPWLKSLTKGYADALSTSTRKKVGSTFYKVTELV